MLPAQPKFVSGGAGRLFVMDHQPASAVLGSILFAPPFAEEMNRSRRMIHLQSRRLAALGYQVLVPDLFGTGDSEGDFEDGSWSVWKGDLATVLEALVVDRAKPIYVWALRLGALLALDALAEGELSVSAAVVWNPCTSGRAFMNQFLRMRTMADMIAASAEQETVSDLRARLLAGEVLEVAGYDLRPELAADIDCLSIEPLILRTGVPLYWLEIVANADRGLSPGSARLIEGLREKGRVFDTRAVEGPAFWATPETSIAPDLLDEMSLIFEHPHG